MATRQQPAAHPRGGGAFDPRLRARRGLLAVTVLVTVGEAAALQAIGMHGAVGLAPQAAAPTPYAVFHDLRWLLVYHRSMVGFALEAVGMLAGRALLSALLAQLAWRDPETRPPFPVLLRRSAAFTVVCALLLAPFAGLMFGAGIASVSWLVLAAVPSVLAIAIVVGHGSAGGRWFATAPPARVAGWMASSFVGYTMAAAALTAAPGVLVVPLAALAGLFDAWVWRGIVRAVAGLPVAPPRRRSRLVTVGALAGFACVLTTGASIGFHAARIHLRLAAPAETAWGSGRPVMVVSGFGTPWGGAAPRYLGDGFVEWRYSYAGMTPQSRPRPYAGPQTYQPLPLLVRRMAAQIDAFHRQTGRQVTLVAESEGALVAETYLHSTPYPPVDALVVLSPLIDPGRVYYPPSSGSGYGVAAGWELRGLSATIETLGSEAISGDNPFLRSVADRAPQLHNLLGCPVAGIDQLAVLPLADATSTPYAAGIAIPTVVVPGFHGGLLGDDHVQHLVARYLRSGSVRSSPVLAMTQQAIQAGAAAWEVPGLPVADNPAWAGLATTDCAATAGALHTWVYGKADHSGGVAQG